MDWFKRKKKTSEDDLASLIEVSPFDDEPVLPIVVTQEAPVPVIRVTHDMLQKAWPGAIDAVPILNQNLRQELKKRTRALGITQNIVLLPIIDNEGLFFTLQQTTSYQEAIAQALSRALGTPLSLQFTDTITITFDPEEPILPAPLPPRIVKSIIDQTTQQLFVGSGDFSLVTPEEVVRPLPLQAIGVELHWFQVRRENTYYDVFCISAAADASLFRSGGQGIRLSADRLSSPVSMHYALSPQMIEEIAQRILTHLAQEKHPVVKHTFFLAVAAFPQEGIHHLTRPFDLAPTRATPIPIAATTAGNLEPGLPSSTYLQERLDDWTRRANRYYRATPVTGEDYYRQDATAETIRECIRLGQPFGLFGLRRMGKTSLLLEMSRAQAFGTVCISFKNTQGYLGRPAWLILRDALTDWITQLAAFLPAAQRASLSQFDPRRAFEPLNIDLFKQYLHHMLSLLPAEMRLVLILDEVGELLPMAPDFQHEQFPDWREFLAFLRAMVYESQATSQRYADQQPHFVLGVAHYQDDIVYSSFGRDSNYNPWWKQFREIRLGPLSRGNLDRMVQDIGAMAGFYYTPEALDLLYAKAFGYPQITRELCDELTKRIKTIPSQVTTREIEATIGHFVRHNSTIRATYKSLQPVEQAIIDYLATVEVASSSEIGRANEVEEALAAYGTDKGTLNDILIKMHQYGLIEKGDHQVRLTFGLFRDYVTSYQNEKNS